MRKRCRMMRNGGPCNRTANHQVVGPTIGETGELNGPQITYAVGCAECCTEHGLRAAAAGSVIERIGG